MSVNQDFVDKCLEFFRNYYHEDIGQLAQRYPKEQRSLVVDWQDMFTFSPAFADDYLSKPEQVREHMTEALRMYDLPVDVGFETAHVRVTNIESERTHDIGEYLPDDIGEVIAVRGQVAQVSQPKPEVATAVFECLRCGSLSTVPQAGADLQQPHECAGCERQGPFQLKRSESDFLNSQVVRLTRPPELAGTGDAHVDIRLKDDLANVGIHGGERVTISGVLSIDEDDLEDRTFDYYLAGDDIQIDDGGFDDIDPSEHAEEIDEIRNSDDPIGMLVDSLAPHLARDEKLDTIMEALVLQMVGTARKDPERGPSYRGDSHILLLGDPGTSKSELLEQVETLSPRAKLKSGEGLTQAGMTAAATKDDFGQTEFSLKAGLMVLASGGIACLDEVDKADDKALNSAHQALENQRVSVSKGGIDADLPSRTALLAAGNPKHGRFDQMEPIGDQIDLSPALMSRFDLMFMLQDQPDHEWDSEVGTKVVDAWSETGKAAHRGIEADQDIHREVPVEVYQAYLAKAKQDVDPVIDSEEVKDKIVDHYLDLRSNGADEDSAVPVTARKLEAFLRLSEASARARFSDTVEPEDVERAHRLVLASMHDVGIDPETGEFDVDVVETGTSKSQRDRIKRYQAVIRDVSDDYDGDGAPLDEVVKMLIEMGDSEKKVENQLEKMRRKGEVYEPRTDWISLT